MVRGQDKREQCAEPFTLGRFLVSQGVREPRRDVRKNDAHRVEAKNGSFYKRCRTLLAILGKGPGRGAEALPRAGFWRSISGFVIRFLPLVLECPQTQPDGWRRKTGGGVELAGSFSGGFRR